MARALGPVLFPYLQPFSLQLPIHLIYCLRNISLAIVLLLMIVSVIIYMFLLFADVQALSHLRTRHLDYVWVNFQGLFAT